MFTYTLVPAIPESVNDSATSVLEDEGTDDHGAEEGRVATEDKIVELRTRLRHC